MPGTDQPQTNNPNPRPKPAKPDEGQTFQPPPSTPEVNPAKPATNTEVDLDKNKTETYPKTPPPERH